MRSADCQSGLHHLADATHAARTPAVGLMYGGAEGQPGVVVAHHIVCSPAPAGPAWPQMCGAKQGGQGVRLSSVRGGGGEPGNGGEGEGWGRSIAHGIPTALDLAATPPLLCCVYICSQRTGLEEQCRLRQEWLPPKPGMPHHDEHITCPLCAECGNHTQLIMNCWVADPWAAAATADNTML